SLTRPSSRPLFPSTTLFRSPVARAVGRHHGDERCLAAGNPGLAAQAMAFEHGNAQRKLERIAPRHADAGLAVVAPELDTPQVVISPGGPAVDREPGPSAPLEYLAEGCEGFLVQSFELEYGHDLSLSAAALSGQPPPYPQPADAAIGKHIEPDMGDRAQCTDLIARIKMLLVHLGFLLAQKLGPEHGL